MTTVLASLANPSSSLGEKDSAGAAAAGMGPLSAESFLSSAVALCLHDAMGTLLPVNTDKFLQGYHSVAEVTEYLTQHIFPLDVVCYNLIVWRPAERSDAALLRPPAGPTPGGAPSCAGAALPVGHIPPLRDRPLSELVPVTAWPPPCVFDVPKNHSSQASIRVIHVYALSSLSARHKELNRELLQAQGSLSVAPYQSLRAAMVASGFGKVPSNASLGSASTANLTASITSWQMRREATSTTTASAFGPSASNHGGWGTASSVCAPLGIANLPRYGSSVSLGFVGSPLRPMDGSRGAFSPPHSFASQTMAPPKGLSTTAPPPPTELMPQTSSTAPSLGGRPVAHGAPFMPPLTHDLSSMYESASQAAFSASFGAVSQGGASAAGATRTESVMASPPPQRLALAAASRFADPTQLVTSAASFSPPRADLAAPISGGRVAPANLKDGFPSRVGLFVEARTSGQSRYSRRSDTHLIPTQSSGAFAPRGSTPEFTTGSVREAPLSTSSSQTVAQLRSLSGGSAPLSAPLVPPPISGTVTPALLTMTHAPSMESQMDSLAAYTPNQSFANPSAAFGAAGSSNPRTGGAAVRPASPSTSGMLGASVTFPRNPQFHPTQRLGLTSAAPASTVLVPAGGTSSGTGVKDGTDGDGARSGVSNSQQTLSTSCTAPGQLTPAASLGSQPPFTSVNAAHGGSFLPSGAASANAPIGGGGDGGGGSARLGTAASLSPSTAAPTNPAASASSPVPQAAPPQPPVTVPQPVPRPQPTTAVRGWHNPVPPLAKSTVSLAMTLHLNDIAPLQRLLTHYTCFEAELLVRKLLETHPFLRSEAARAFMATADPRTRVGTGTAQSPSVSPSTSKTRRPAEPETEEASTHPPLGSGSVVRHDRRPHPHGDSPSAADSPSNSLSRRRRTSGRPASNQERMPELFRCYFRHLRAVQESQWNVQVAMQDVVGLTTTLLPHFYVADVTDLPSPGSLPASAVSRVAEGTASNPHSVPHSRARLSSATSRPFSTPRRKQRPLPLAGADRSDDPEEDELAHRSSVSEVSDEDFDSEDGESHPSNAAVAPLSSPTSLSATSRPHSTSHTESPPSSFSSRHTRNPGGPLSALNRRREQRLSYHGEVFSNDPLSLQELRTFLAVTPEVATRVQECPLSEVDEGRRAQVAHLQRQYAKLASALSKEVNSRVPSALPSTRTGSRAIHGDGNGVMFGTLSEVTALRLLRGAKDNLAVAMDALHFLAWRDVQESLAARTHGASTGGYGSSTISGGGLTPSFTTYSRRLTETPLTVRPAAIATPEFSAVSPSRQLTDAAAGAETEEGAGPRQSHCATPAPLGGATGSTTQTNVMGSQLATPGATASVASSSLRATSCGDTAAAAHGQPSLSAFSACVSFSPQPPERAQATMQEIETSLAASAWMSSIEEAVRNRRAKVECVSAIVSAIGRDPNAIATLWYTSEGDMMQALKVVVQAVSMGKRR